MVLALVFIDFKELQLEKKAVIANAVNTNLN
jgi:hypothetical protein